MSSRSFVPVVCALLVSLFAPCLLSAQVEMSITGSLTLRPTDADAASYYRQMDSDDNVCALIKVKTSNPMSAMLVLNTGGGLAPVPPPKGVSNKQADGSWWYWLSPKTRNIFFTAEGYKETSPLGVRLEAGKVYELKLTVGAAAVMVQSFNLEESVLKLNITPKECVVSYGKDDNFDMGVRMISDGYFEEVLAFGTYKVKVENPYYETYVGTHTVDGGTKDESISLTPSFGFLSINSSPSDAQIYLDGSVKSVGNTPFTTDKLTKGKHTIRLFKENYYGSQTEVEVKSDGSVQSVPTISLKPQFGTVTCVCEDADATLTVTDAAGRVVRQGKSGMRLELGSKGNYKLESSKASHYAQSVGIQGGASLEGQELTVSIGAPVPIYGGLQITSEPTRAEVWIDGEKVGSTTWVGKMLIGEHQVELKKEGYYLEPFTVNINENEKLSVSKKMNEGPRPNSFGKQSANCYVVSRPGTYFFYTVKGNSSESVGRVSSVEVLWESFGTSTTPNKGDIIESVSFKAGANGSANDAGTITFSTPATLKNGNAVIAAKDANGKILWSWHIWVCEGFDPIATAQKYYNNAGIMMDRNLGATSATPGDVGALGLLYQWGRKDPFLGSSSILFSNKAASTGSWPYPVSSDSSKGTIAYAVAHPTTFITFHSSNYDWYDTGSHNTDNKRWQTSKTIYDPCPPGWKVPTGGIGGVWSKSANTSSSFFYTWDSTNKGMNFSNKFGSASPIWYPAAGYLTNHDGSLRGVGSGGHWWSWAPGVDGAFSLLLNRDGDVFPSGYGRAGGRSVRCLQE